MNSYREYCCKFKLVILVDYFGFAYVHPSQSYDCSFSLTAPFSECLSFVFAWELKQTQYNHFTMLPVRL